MAIIVKEKEKKLNWFNLAIGIFIIIVIGSLVYFLFLSPAPFIEKIAPLPETQNISSFSQLNDPAAILSNPAFSSLHLYVPNPDTGELGRENPFLKLF